MIGLDCSCHVEARNDPFGGIASRGSSDKIQTTKTKYHLNDLRILNVQTKRKIIIDTTLEAQHNHHLLLHLPQGTNPLLRPEIRGLILQEMMRGVEVTIQKESVTTFETH